MAWRPSEPGERPTLGYLVLDWMAEYLIVPDGPAAGGPLLLTREQAEFVLRLYEVDPLFDSRPIVGRSFKNARLIRRGVLSRSKGWGKSPLGAGLSLVEALGPVVLDGWDADGQPVGREWSTFGFKPKVQVLAASEDQTGNIWDPLLEMARNGPVVDAYEIDPMESFVVVPRGIIEPVTASARSREGYRPVFAVMDQTESWVPSVGGPKLAAVTRRNLAKVQGCSVEFPNAFVPGENSVAEASFAAESAQSEGRTRIATGILFDHREAPPETDPTDRDSLHAGLAYAYGDSADANGGWVTLDRLIAEYWDPDTHPQDARRYYLNQVTHASDSWITQPEWAARLDLDKVIGPDDPVVLGFDGSRRRSRGVTDATGLIACRVTDGHLVEVEVWEQPDGPAGDDWQVPVEAVKAAVRGAFGRWSVVGFYADPAMWESHVAEWEAAYGTQLKVKSSRDHPIEWWMTGGRNRKTVQALEQFHSALIDGEMTHDGSSTLARHVLNARRRPSRSGMQIGKEHPDSARKIDAAVAAVLAWQCRLDALAKGIGRQTQARVPFRIR